MKRMRNVKEAAKATGLSECELKRGVHAGIYPYIRVGEGRGKFLFDIDMLNDVITRRAMDNMKTNHEKENILPFGMRKIY